MTSATATLPCSATRSMAMTNRGFIVGVSTVLLLPSAVFATSLRFFPAIAVLAGCCLALSLIASTPIAGQGDSLADRIDWRRLAACGIVALGLLFIGGETHLLAPTWDWLTRDAVLSDLVRNGFPVGYRVTDNDLILRAPLGMYMLPALVGRMFGLAAAHLVLLTQNAALLGASLYILAMIGRGWPHLVILLLFAGASIIGAALRIAALPTTSVPFWLQFGLESWHPLFQYSGSLVQLFWVPNHALPAWWLACLLLLNARGQVDITTVGASVAGALFWSPLCILPVVSWLLFQASCHPRAILLARRTWLGLGAACGFLPILVYLLAASATIASGTPTAQPDFFFWYVLFIAIQLPALPFLAFAWRAIDPEDRVLLAISALLLLALPFVRFGPNNDLAMRGSIVPLVIVAFVFGKVVLRLSERRKAGALIGWMLVAASTPSAIVEIGRAVMTPTFAISDCSLPQASRALGDETLPTNYVAPIVTMPAWLLEPPNPYSTPTEDRPCWPDRVAPRFFWSVSSSH